MRAWVHHAALNAGAALEALIFAVLPPQIHHTQPEVDGLRSGTTLDWFRYGLGIGDRPR